jgi:hypothetical protein
MGQRANLVVLRDGDWRLYYDHWCANRLDVELFWGPELALQFIEQRDDDIGWLDDVWCEGAVLLDLDQRVLLFFGGEDVYYDIPLRRAHLALMSANWPEWNIRWAHEGIVSIGDYLKLDRVQFLTGKGPEADGRFTCLTDYPEDNSTLLTIAETGSVAALQGEGNIELLELGPLALEDVRAAPETAPLIWKGQFPGEGVHFDFDRRILSFWSAGTLASIEKIAAAWPGWKVNWLRDDFESHIALSGLDIRLPYRPFAELQAECIETLRRRHNKEAGNPARALQQRLGETAEVNPATDIFRGSVASGDEKLELLDHLSRQLPIGGAAHH